MEEEPAEDGADSIPDYLKHLPVEQHKLLKDIVEIILAKPKIVECGWVQGAAPMGLPHDPSKPTTCCCILQNLDVSKIELGGLPRDEIYQEMEGNPSKLAKQRRDVTFPDGEMDSQPMKKNTESVSQFHSMFCWSGECEPVPLQFLGLQG